MRVFSSPSELSAAKGEHLGYSQWHTITQDQVNTFADATGDHQWIHVNVERAGRGPFGGPIAHGYLTLALLPKLTAEIYRIEGIKMGINYGSNKVRFPNTVRVGARVRVGVEVMDVVEGDRGTQVLTKNVVEIEGQEKPACVSETLTLLVP